MMHTSGKQTVLQEIKGVASLLLFISALLMAGCSGRLTSGSNISPEILYKRTARNIEKVRSLRGSGTMIVVSPEQSFRAQFRIAADYPDSIRIKIDGTFGIDVLDLFMSGKKILAYFSNDNKFYSDVYSAELLESLIYIKTSFKEILEVSKGIIPVPQFTGIPGCSAVNAGKKILAIHDSDGSREVWNLESKGRYAVTYNRYAADSTVTKTIELKRFQRVKGVPLPGYVRYVYPREKTSITLIYRYRDINVDYDKLDFTVDVPRNAERVYQSSGRND